MEKDEGIQLFMESLLQKYQPVEIAGKTTETQSTTELMNPFTEFSGIPLEREAVFNAMREEGFKYRWVGNEINWLLAKSLAND